eukprot:Awhi_evm2s4426
MFMPLCILLNLSAINCNGEILCNYQDSLCQMELSCGAIVKGNCTNIQPAIWSITNRVEETSNYNVSNYTFSLFLQPTCETSFAEFFVQEGICTEIVIGALVNHITIQNETQQTQTESSTRTNTMTTIAPTGTSTKEQTTTEATTSATIETSNNGAKHLPTCIFIYSVFFLGNW